MVDSYVYAKIFSMMPHTYVRDNLKKLLTVKGLEEIYDILFPGERFELQGQRLVTQLQKKVNLRSIGSIIRILELLELPHPVLIHILRRYEYQNLKSLLSYLKHDENEKLPFLWDLGKYALLPLKKLKSIKKEKLKKYLQKSRYAWVVEKEMFDQPFYLQANRLDLDYYKRLWKLARTLPKTDSAAILKLVSAEVLLMNVCWALRLRFYFKVNLEKARELLIDVGSRKLIQPALEVFEFPADEPAGWQNWKMAWLVKDQLHKEMQGIDPVKANEKAARYLTSKTWKLFHHDPFTFNPFYCFIKIKEHEANLLQSVIEGFAMKLPHNEILGVTDSL